MLSSDKTATLRALAAVFAFGALGILSACQVRPLYGNAPVVAELATVGISEPTSRVEQAVRNQLVFILSGGAGEPEHPTYDLALKVTSSSSSYVAQIPSNVPRPGRLTLTATYVLSRGGETVRTGKRTMDALLDYPSQQFAQIRAVRDAEDRAARELAELIRMDIAVALTK